MYKQRRIISHRNSHYSPRYVGQLIKIWVEKRVPLSDNYSSTNLFRNFDPLIVFLRSAIIVHNTFFFISALICWLELPHSQFWKHKDTCCLNIFCLFLLYPVMKFWQNCQLEANLPTLCNMSEDFNFDRGGKGKGSDQKGEK